MSGDNFVPQLESLYRYAVRIIAKRTLRLFQEENLRYRDTKPALEDWYAHASRADWVTPAEIKADYGDANILKGSRGVFNICGNKHRLKDSLADMHYLWDIAH